MSDNPLLTHGVVAVIIKDGKLLLIKDPRPEMKDHWGPPAGACRSFDVNETDTVKAKVMSEVGLDIQPVKKLWTTKADTKIKTISFWLVKPLTDSIIIDPECVSAYGWFSPKEALCLKLYPATRDFLVLVQNGQISIK